jgi:hypothetical protein
MNLLGRKGFKPINYLKMQKTKSDIPKNGCAREEALGPPWRSEV